MSNTQPANSLTHQLYVIDRSLKNLPLVELQTQRLLTLYSVLERHVQEKNTKLLKNLSLNTANDLKRLKQSTAHVSKTYESILSQFCQLSTQKELHKLTVTAPKQYVAERFVEVYQEMATQRNTLFKLVQALAIQINDLQFEFVQNLRHQQEKLGQILNGDLDTVFEDLEQLVGYPPSPQPRDAINSVLSCVKVLEPSAAADEDEYPPDIAGRGYEDA